MASKAVIFRIIRQREKGELVRSFASAHLRMKYETINQINRSNNWIKSASSAGHIGRYKNKLFFFIHTRGRTRSRDDEVIRGGSVSTMKYTQLEAKRGFEYTCTIESSY